MLKSTEKTIYHTLVFLLAIVSAAINLYQTRQVTPLIDYTYSADAAYRIFLGEIPYRDFYLAYTPFTYYSIAGLITLTGEYNHMVQVFGTMVTSALVIMVNFFLFNKVTKSPWISLVMTFPLLFSGYSIYPYALYDIQIFFVIQIVILLTLDFESYPDRPVFKGLLTGSLAALTALIKQNVGLVFIVIWVLCVLVVFFSNRTNGWLRYLGGAVAGYITVIGGFLLFLYKTDSLSSFYYQTILVPSQIRNPVTGLVKTYMEMETFIGSQKIELLFLLAALITCPVLFHFLNSMLRKIANPRIAERIHQVAVSACFLLLVSCLVFLLLNRSINQINLGVWLIMIFIASIIWLMDIYTNLRKHEISFFQLIPGLCLLIFFASSISQGFTGSSYGMWPMFFLLFAWLNKWLKDHNPLFPWNKLTVCLCIFLTTFMGFSAFSEWRMNYYVDLSGELNSSTIPSLKGLTARGKWLPEFDSLVEYVNNNLPSSDPVAFFAGEDVFYPATHRKSPSRCFFYVGETCDQKIGYALKEMESKKVKWLIIKTQYQYRFWRETIQISEEMIPSSYKSETDVGIYKIYKYSGNIESPVP